MTMKIESEKKDEKLTLWLCGRLETSTAPQLQRVVETDLEGVVQLLIDMKQLEYISSAGLRVLLAAYKKLKAKGGSLHCHPPFINLLFSRLPIPVFFQNQYDKSSVPLSVHVPQAYIFRS